MPARLIISEKRISLAAAAIRTLAAQALSNHISASPLSDSVATGASAIQISFDAAETLYPCSPTLANRTCGNNLLTNTSRLALVRLDPAYFRAQSTLAVSCHGGVSDFQDRRIEALLERRRALREPGQGAAAHPAERPRGCHSVAIRSHFGRRRRFLGHTG